MTQHWSSACSDQLAHVCCMFLHPACICWSTKTQFWACSLLMFPALITDLCNASWRFLFNTCIVDWQQINSAFDHVFHVIVVYQNILSAWKFPKRIMTVFVFLPFVDYKAVYKCWYVSGCYCFKYLWYIRLFIGNHAHMFAPLQYGKFTVLFPWMKQICAPFLFTKFDLALVNHFDFITFL